MKVPMVLPFCLFLILVIFLSLAPPREANGRRAGEAMVVTVVILKWLMEESVVDVMSLASGMCVGVAKIFLAQ